MCIMYSRRTIFRRTVSDHYSIYNQIANYVYTEQTVNLAPQQSATCTIYGDSEEAD